MKYVLAIDVAKNKSMATLIDHCGEVYFEPYEFNHTLSDFKNLLERIESFDIFETDLAVLWNQQALIITQLKDSLEKKLYIM